MKPRFLPSVAFVDLPRRNPPTVMYSLKIGVIIPPILLEIRQRKANIYSNGALILGFEAIGVLNG